MAPFSCPLSGSDVQRVLGHIHEARNPTDLAVFPAHCVHHADLTIAGLHIKYFKLGQSPEDQSNGPDQVRVSSEINCKQSQNLVSKFPNRKAKREISWAMQFLLTDKRQQM